jgi:hypothetical protein
LYYFLQNKSESELILLLKFWYIKQKSNTCYHRMLMYTWTVVMTGTCYDMWMVTYQIHSNISFVVTIYIYSLRLGGTISLCFYLVTCGFSTWHMGQLCLTWLSKVNNYNPQLNQMHFLCTMIHKEAHPSLYLPATCIVA